MRYAAALPPRYVISLLPLPAAVPPGGSPGGGNGGGPAGHRNGSTPRRNGGGNGPGRSGNLPEDAAVRVAMAALEAAADFESGDEDFEVASNAALRALRPFPERASSAAAAPVPPYSTR
ncbi:hypothetical protein DL768_007627 [Monosporascus sp. mg162]|nr:hypothetical protein DL768_007627 [Monosporascus sp. mg162]